MKLKGISQEGMKRIANKVKAQEETYRVYAIEADGLGELLSTFDDEGAAYAFAEEVAYDYYYGVTIEHDGMFDDDGNGEFEYYEERS